MRPARRARSGRPAALALIEQLFSRVAWHHDGLDRNLALQLAGDQREHVRFNFVKGAAGQNFGAFLGSDDMLQDQARVMLDRQFRGKAATTCWLRAG